MRVRVGIHSGNPTLSTPNYIGMVVNTAARICDAAHGGQILVSGATREAARGRGTRRCSLSGLGSTGCAGCPDPVPLFQIAAKGLLARFPPPRTSNHG